MDKPPLVVFVGPTAVGKTEISILVAERMQGEIVSADSRLFYRGMDIGTAKPAPSQLARVPHHLIDVVDPDETWSLAVFQRAAARAIAGIHARLRLPFLVGGTGQYLRAVTQGWSPPAVAPHPEMRAVLEALAGQHGVFWLHDRLKQSDPLAASTIDPRNVRRTVRALEVILTTGRAFSQVSARGRVPYNVLTVGLMRPREELYRRIDERIEAMFVEGLLEEVEGLLARGYDSPLPSMSAIGYREACAVLRGSMSLEQAKAGMRRATRAFVRRQANWFKPDDPAITWFVAGQAETPALIQAFLRARLGDTAVAPG